MGQPKEPKYDNYSILMRKREHETLSKVFEFFTWFLLKLVVTRKYCIQNIMIGIVLSASKPGKYTA